MHRVRWTQSVGVLLLLIPLAGCLGADPPSATATRDPSWAIATTHPLAAQAGAEVLAAGGNAIDAAAAIQFVLNVVEPGMSGMGGGAFFMAHLANGTLVALDGRETAPAATTADLFASPGPPIVTRGTAVGVPGTVALWVHALAAHGTMDLGTVMAPAINIATHGFTVDAYLADYVRAYQSKLEASPAAAELYLPGSVCRPVVDYMLTWQVPVCSGGVPLVAGQRFANPDLAATLQAIADGGSAAFYDGALAQAMVDAVAEKGGILTRADLTGYAVVERHPIRMEWQGYEVATFPPPGGGLVVAQLLGLTSHFPLAEWGPEAADTLHVMAEAMSLAFADRAAYLADPAFVDVPVAELLAADYVADRAGLIDLALAKPARAGEPGAAPAGSPASVAFHEGVHTTHFAVADVHGNVVSVTSTIEDVWGSGIMAPGTGFFLNNEMTDFSPAGTINEPAPGKRPRSSMAPSIVYLDDQPILAAGASGGPRIIAATFQTILRTLVHEESVADAVLGLRVYAPDVDMEYDRSLPPNVMSDLQDRGHDLSRRPIGNAQALLWDEVWTAGADDRAATGAVRSGVAR